MSAVAETSIDAAAGDRLARRNATILAVAQALAGGNNAVLISTGAIVGAMLAPDRGLATVPVTVYVLGMWMGTLPTGWIARHYGRRASFYVGTGFGVLTGLIACAAVLTASFLTVLHRRAVQRILCGGASVLSLCGRRHRERSRSDPKAISWVMVGGIFAGIIGPQLVIVTKDLWQPYLFAGTFLAQAAMAVVVGRRSDAGENSHAAAAHGDEPGPPAVRNRASAALHRGGRLRRRQLFHDEHGDDLGAARHGRMQSFGGGGDARHPVARDGHVRAEPLHRLADPALRRRAHDRASGLA